MHTNETVTDETIADATAAAAESPAVSEAPIAEQPQAEGIGAAFLEELQQARLKADEYQDQWLRAKAETENVRRRAQEDIAKAAKFSIDRFARELLPVKDSLEAALAADGATVDSLRAGSELTLKQLVAAFEKSALVEINPLGEKFDPNRHQAISVVESAQVANTVVTVLQKGYLLADRVLRPALVIVAKAAP
ncbi:MAG TPA: nucleotide exchange factor GrpE [Candidatus Accumulibacter phosphatis]|nr:MAG: HSP-70 cofactor [Candidatus Accumulibacter sp. SK-11]HAY27020.1 nucleotide exchange factor GrpE [Accumulibacter sp.]HCN66813.1 nucleotide exchange factor GrpE [Accumulibacter sp.]HRL75807.1 nucleotide exchange factor GrpE [Candidatus Accumulibacter phosphatis]HRQ94131.1 nucleotide exchange factor GrpE [Candidatus Accumulibacter phosphatis]